MKQYGVANQSTKHKMKWLHIDHSTTAFTSSRMQSSPSTHKSSLSIPLADGMYNKYQTILVKLLFIHSFKHTGFHTGQLYCIHSYSILHKLQAFSEQQWSARFFTQIMVKHRKNANLPMQKLGAKASKVWFTDALLLANDKTRKEVCHGHVSHFWRTRWQCHTIWCQRTAHRKTLRGFLCNLHLRKQEEPYLGTRLWQGQRTSPQHNIHAFVCRKTNHWYLKASCTFQIVSTSGTFI